MSEINQIIPRVGKSAIQDPKVLERLQKMFHDQKDHSCHCLPRNRSNIRPTKGNASRGSTNPESFILERGAGAITYEKYWEKWVNLANRQLIRPAHACRINVTMFAKPWPVEGESSQSSQGSNPVPSVSEPASVQSAPCQTESSHADPVTAMPSNIDNFPIPNEVEGPENNPMWSQDNINSPINPSPCG